MSVLAGDAPVLTLAYLDPVSWLAAIQLIGGVGAWLALRLRRLRRRSSGKAIAPGVVEISAAEARRQLATPSAGRRLVVAIEGARDWPYLEGYLHALAKLGVDLDLWILSAGTLPDLAASRLGPIKAVFDISPHVWRRLMSGIADATVLTTVTDLGSAQFPKASSDVRYVYAFHSLVSTHVAYRPEAFDAYDVVLSPSAQHSAEMRAREQGLSLTPKSIFQVGYPYGDTLARRAAEGPPPPPRTVVIAPSWTSDDHYLTTWLSAARAFARAGWEVVLRPHPETLKRSAGLVRGLNAAIAGDPMIRLDRSAQNGGALPNVTALVSDWSGAAIEFAVAGRPVAFVDTPRKVRNHEWRTIRDGSIEQDLRARSGLVVQPREVDHLPSRLAEAAAAQPTGGSRHGIYNPGQAAQEGARLLLSLVRGDPD